LCIQTIEAEAAKGNGRGRAGEVREGRGGGEGRKRKGWKGRKGETDAYRWRVSSEYLTGLFSALSMCMSQTDPASRPPPTQKGRSQ